MEGTVIGLWSESGYPFASILYDCWGNVVAYECASNWNEIFKANHIGYKSYYFDDESGFYYDGQNDYYEPQLGQNLNMKESNQIIEQEKVIITEDLYYGDYIKSKDSSIIFPMEQKGYKVDYDVDQYVSYCDTQSLFFESMGLYNTNCYGFATNCWLNPHTHGLDFFPGIFSGYGFGVGAKYIPCSTVAQWVKADYEAMGKEIVLLKGRDNNPYYETDENHYLIALRTMTEEAYYSTKFGDSFHFMIRKEDGWYFKSGWKGGIFKLKGNYTPSTVKWLQYAIDERYNQYRKVGTVEYGSGIQYIVVPKTALRIE